MLLTEIKKNETRGRIERRVVLDTLLLEDSQVSTWRCQVGSWVGGYRAEWRRVI